MFEQTLLHSLARMAVVATLGLQALTARADLMLYPTRVVFDKEQRAAQVELVNQGKTPETYRISLVNRRMGELGEFQSIEQPGPGEAFADAMVRYSPRQVTIPPGGTQTVRIMLRKPAELAAGEYRSHMQFDRVPDTTLASSVERVDNADGTKVGVVLNALVGASIPVIIRHGDTQARVNLAELAVIPPSKDTAAMLAFQIHREGNRSVYGDLVATFTPKGGRPVEVARAGGVAVYVPNALRRARMPLQLPEGHALKDGTLQVIFRERAEAGGKTMAEITQTLP
jgi:fimbrial chaperone protein